MNKRFLMFISFSILFAGIVVAQQPLQLQEAIAAMKENNTQLKVQQREIELSNAEYSATNSGFLPRISASITGLNTNDPLNAFGFKLQQKIVSQADFNPDLLNNPDAISNFNTQLAIQQPIFNFDVYAARKALQEKIKATSYQKQFAEDMMVLEIKKAYTNLQFLYEAKKAVAKGGLAYEEVLRNTRNLEKQGYAKSADVLMVQVGLSDVQYKSVEIDNNIANLSNYLTWLMRKKENQIYQPTESLTQSLLVGSNDQFSEDRADILAMKSGLQAQQQMVTMHKRQLLPRLNAFGQFNLYDKNITGFGSNAYLAGVSLSWDIFNGNETLNKIKQSKIAVQKSQTEMQVYVEKNQLELQKSKRDLAASQAKILLAQTAKEQAGESLHILENRYTQGLEKTSDLLVSQAADIAKQVSYLEAIKDYNLSVIQIKFLTQQSN